MVINLTDWKSFLGWATSEAPSAKPSAKLWKLKWAWAAWGRRLVNMIKLVTSSPFKLRVTSPVCADTVVFYCFYKRTFLVMQPSLYVSNEVQVMKSSFRPLKRISNKSVHILDFKFKIKNHLLSALTWFIWQTMQCGILLESWLVTIDSQRLGSNHQLCNPLMTVLPLSHSHTHMFLSEDPSWCVELCCLLPCA